MSLVRVGHPPGIYEATDRWGAPSGTWYANEYGLMLPEVWEAVRDFQTWPAMSEEDRQLYLEHRLCDTLPDTAFSRELDRKIRLNPARTTVWQLEMQVPGSVPADSGFVRVCAVLGEPGLVRWTLRDVAALPLWRARARRRSRGSHLGPPTPDVE